MSAPNIPLRKGLLIGCLLHGVLIVGVVRAEESGSLSVVSDYQYRGYSLSDGRPTVIGGLAYDLPSGWYAGTSLIPTRLADQRSWELELLPYVGYAHAMTASLSLEAGIAAASYTRSASLNDNAYLIGINARTTTLRLYVPARHPGVGSRGPYFEWNQHQALSDSVRGEFHAGVLRNDTVFAGPRNNHFQMDVNLGVVMTLASYSLGLAYVAVHNAARVSDYYSQQYAFARPRNELLMTLSRVF